MLTTKVFNNGNSQAIRIPKEYRFDQEEVIISRVGSAVVIYQRSERPAIFSESLREFSDDFMEDGRPSQMIQDERESLD